MPETSLVGLFVAPLHSAKIDYAVTGGLAAVMYGHPRMTIDVDLVIRLAASDADKFASLWSTDEFYVPPLEAIERERARPALGHCNVIHTATAMRADVYFVGEDMFGAWALEHAVVRQMQGHPVRFAPIEYVIVSKLRYFQMGGSDRHLRDVARMVEVSGATVDTAALDRWISHFALNPEWDRSRQYLGKE